MRCRHQTSVLVLIWANSLHENGALVWCEKQRLRNKIGIRHEPINSPCLSCFIPGFLVNASTSQWPPFMSKGHPLAGIGVPQDLMTRHFQLE